MRRFIATHLAYMLALMVTLSVVLAYGVSGVGYLVILLCMIGIFFAGRYAEYVGTHFDMLEKDKVVD